MSILHVSTFELMRLWGELVEAYHGVNGYGGTVAELYAYRFMPHVSVDHMKQSPAYQGEVQCCAATALRELCERFAAEYQCEVMIDGKPPLVWAREDGPCFAHRAHVEVRANREGAD